MTPIEPNIIRFKSALSRFELIQFKLAQTRSQKISSQIIFDSNFDIFI